MSTANGVRYIYSRFGSRHVADLLQAIFAAEILRPSARMWIVSPWISDIPVLDNTLANLQCRIIQTFEGGDHTIFVGEVDEATTHNESPLVYYRGGYVRLTV